MVGEIGKRIRVVRRRASRKDFAAKHGISPTTLKRYEYDERYPDQPFLDSLILSEKISPKWLLSGEGHLYEFEPDNSDQGEAKAPHLQLTTVIDKLIYSLEKNSELQKENGDLRVEIERLRARVAQLENEIKALSCK